MPEAAHDDWHLNVLVAEDTEYHKQRNALVVTQVVQTKNCGACFPVGSRNLKSGCSALVFRAVIFA